jgi:hypothetical protein
MKNTITTSEAKIAICEKFLKDMGKMYDMELKNICINNQTKIDTCDILIKVEKMLTELYKNNTGL